MKQFLLLALLTLSISACSSKKEGNMIVQGQIKGLKKGTLYLQKIQDTLLVSVDSIAMFGEDTYTLVDEVNSPEMYYLTLDDKTTATRIPFFGEPGIITINDWVEDFGKKPSIQGSKNQEVLNEYNKINSQFQNKLLELIQQELKAQQDKDTKALEAVDAASKSLTRRRYLFAVNFALNNADTEVAPYIALTDLVDANIGLLDTINSSLSDKIKSSTYGKKLHTFIDQIKTKEKN